MHCDDKRTLFVLKQDILTCFNDLKEADFDSDVLLKELTNAIQEYNEYKRLT